MDWQKGGVNNRNSMNTTTQETQSVETLPNVILKPTDLDRTVAGHPWIYAGQIAKITGQPGEGALVCVRDPKRRLLGIGFYNPNSQIQVRLISRRRTAVDEAFFISRLQEALAFRRRHLPHAEAFRWVNSEGDYLSGLIIDVYGKACVLQTTALGMEQRKEQILRAIQKILQPDLIVERNDFAGRRFEGLEPQKSVLHGTLSGPIPIHINDLRFEADIWEGHKTGWYLDQQTNYQVVVDFLSRFQEPLVLDAFCYTGAFGIHAAAKVQARVHFVDQSPQAIEKARMHAQWNGVEDRCEFIAANVFDWLRAKAGTGRSTPPTVQYDAVILDPPSFTRHRSAVPEALRGYKEIHIRALRLLRPGGLLFTFSCSHHVSRELFLAAIVGAAADVRCLLRQVAVLGQSPDHTIMPMIPETEYLKGFVFEKMG